MYLNSVTIVGFAGAGPEQRQARNNSAKFVVLSIDYLLQEMHRP